MDRQPAGGPLRAGLCLRALRDLGLLDRRAAPRPGALAVVVLEQHRREAPAHVPFHVEREHAHEHVRLHVVGRAAVDRTDAQVGLRVPERALHARERLVRIDRGLRPHGLRSQAGADHVDAVEPGLGGDPVLAAAPGDAVVGDVDLEMLAHLAAVHAPAHTAVDRRPALEPARAHRRRDPVQRRLRGPEQVLALAGPLLPQPRVQADHQPLAGEVRARDLRHGVGQLVSTAQIWTRMPS
ncbi:MAG: hypothetical protein F4213_19800 [Boseongicola sp. SB0677_bin_26]|nr:hypothetical protein [Boseongicola sp. SB0677_bin_26]